MGARTRSLVSLRLLSVRRAGKIGTAVAQQNLRSILSFCNSPQMNAPEAYIQFTPGLITEDGEVTDETTRKYSCGSSWSSSSSSWNGSLWCFPALPKSAGVHDRTRLHHSGVSTGEANGPDSEGEPDLKDLPDSLSLGLQRLPLIGSKPGERFNRVTSMLR